MSFRQVLILLFLSYILIFAVPASAADWLPASPDELAMKDNPAEPGAHAMILYREYVSDDVEGWLTEYVRIKVFTEEGRKWGNVDIPTLKNVTWVSDIKARTIRPDGSIVEWQGKPLEKLIVKNKQVKYYALTFTLPDVQKGSIIEYRYRRMWDKDYLYSDYWNVQANLFTRRAHFSLRPYRGEQYTMNWITRSLPAGLTLKPDSTGRLDLEMKDIPAFREEPYMPPEALYKMRVDFYYSTRRAQENAEEFWRKEGKQWHDEVEKFIGKPGAVQDVVAATVSAGDPPEVKLRKLYERAQKIKNSSFGPDKTEQELKREKIKENTSVADVLKRGSGDREDINRVFVALVRAAGMEASVVRGAPRSQDFFNPQLEDRRKLSAEITLVHLPGGDLYLDPGTATCPFGMLPWTRTAVQSLRLDRSGGVFVTTPQPQSKDATVERKATLQLADDGSLSGKLEITFVGQEALERRLDGLDTDETGRRKLIKDEIASWLPDNSTVELAKITGWETTDQPLQVEATVKIPELAAMTGRRMLLPEGIFQVREKYPLQQARRQYPVYFPYPYRESDQVVVQFPAGYRLESLPVPRQASPNYGEYKMFGMREGSSVRLQRSFAIERILFKAENYSILQNFYDLVRAGDEDRMVLQTTAQ